MNSKSRLFLIVGISATAIYLVALYFVVAPWSDFLNFMRTAPLNERGDFMAGAFGPMAFMWLVIGYLIQADELSQQRQYLIAQNSLMLHQLELQKRKSDPLLSMELDHTRVAHLKNISAVEMRQVIVFYVNHVEKRRHILAMATALFGDHDLPIDLKPPLSLPLWSPGTESPELLIVYNSDVDDLRCQRFQFKKQGGNYLLWQIGSASDLPDYFLGYA